VDKVGEIDSLDSIEKLSIYMHYFVNNNTLKIVYGGVFVYSFDDFISKDRIDIRDMGESWKTNGMASRFWVQLGGIYDYYWKFKDEITLI